MHARPPVALEDAHQGRGIGSALLRHALRTTDQVGCPLDYPDAFWQHDCGGLREADAGTPAR